eukprot:TRINITY_DN4300_c1_g1_i1.p1 TRINITY_DN4300_c1_g1~~TRINITY_DN4300_c1_g1_i1.p1  ORF type:complete len:216 (+),score=27.17 TRINITY_DN4300_c1_g1_i1:45-650(+)
MSNPEPNSIPCWQRSNKRDVEWMTTSRKSFKSGKTNNDFIPSPHPHTLPLPHSHPKNPTMSTSSVLMTNNSVKKGMMQMTDMSDHHPSYKRFIANNFGKKHMEKLGWNHGDGLGKKRDGRRRHIKVNKRAGNAGVCVVSSPLYHSPSPTNGLRTDFLSHTQPPSPDRRGTNNGKLPGHLVGPCVLHGLESTRKIKEKRRRQ